MIVFFGVKFTGDYHNVTIVPTLFQDHRQKSKNRFFHRFSYFWLWSRNNYVMIPTTWLFPVNFTLKTYTSKWNFEKKNFQFPNGVSGSISKSRKRPFCDVGRNFFFLSKKKLTRVYWGEVYWRWPWCCNHCIIISGSQSKFKNPNFSSFFLLLTVITK